MLSLVGGKWTTFRALSEHMSNDVLELLGKERKVSTAGLAIGGGVGFPKDEKAVESWILQHTGPQVDAQRAAVLLTRYGSRAEQVIEYLEAGTDKVLDSTYELSIREVAYIAAHEQLGHLVDVLIRRTSLAFRGLVTGELLTELAEALRGPLNWSDERVQFELRHAEIVLDRFHRVQVQNLVV